MAVGIGVPTGNEKNPALSKSSVKFETQPYSNSRKRASGCRGAIIYHVLSSFLALKSRQSSPFRGFNKYPYAFPGPVRTKVVKSVLMQSSTLSMVSLVDDGVIVISGVGVSVEISDGVMVGGCVAVWVAVASRVDVIVGG